MDKAKALIPLLTSAALIESMSVAGGRSDCRTIPSKRKSALPVKKSKRKATQASKKKNR